VNPLRIGYSPCPNDTYIMAGLAGGRVEAPVAFQPVLADVETLNQWAVETLLEATKLSFMAFALVRETYGLLYSGGALGWGCGPLVVAKPGRKLDNIGNAVVAAPGALTTAGLLLSLHLGRAPNFKHMLFSEIMPSVAREEADYGLVIHEGRFMLAESGLSCLLDLGQWWEQETGRPLPLGGIAVRRSLGTDTARMVDRAIRSSLGCAEQFPAETMKYVLEHAQEMDPDVVRQHIQLYVNSFSLNLGREGEEAISTLFSRAEHAGLIPASPLPVMAF
jgi:1,4-dihydroxy-6-naphthoate synthase